MVDDYGCVLEKVDNVAALAHKPIMQPQYKARMEPNYKKGGCGSQKECTRASYEEQPFYSEGGFHERHACGC